MKESKLAIKAILSAVTCFLIIAGMSQVAKANKGPRPQKQHPKKQMSVATIPVVKENVAVSVTGYGQVNPVETNKTSPQVSGKIIEKTSFKQGKTVQKGELLFKIDATGSKRQLLLGKKPRN